MKRDPLLELATAIADGTPIDWTDAERPQPTDPRAIEAARALELLASLHASQGGGGSAGASSPLAPAVAGQTEAPATWGPLTIGALIGRGRFGDVYRAQDSRLDRPVALKLLHVRDRLETTLVEEGRLLARVRHPNVVMVHGAERIDGRAGLWMEFVDGQTLADELAAQGPLPAVEVVRIGAALAGALAAVHRAGLLHRDVKAQNVMRDCEGRVVLMDFGTGHDWMAEREDQPGLAGTPLYLAPETLEGAPATIASDIYSLGVLLHLLATGTFPVQGRSVRELRDAHALATGPVIGPAARAKMPRRLARAVAKALARDPRQRFATAAQMADALAPSSIGARWKLGAAVAAGITIAAGGMAWLRPLPATTRTDTGITVEHFSPDVQARIAFLGPAVGDLVTCAPRDRPLHVAICDWRNGQVQQVLRDSRTGGSEPQSLVGPAILSPNAARIAYVWTVGRGDRRSLNVINVETRANTEFPDTQDVRIGRWTANGQALIVHELSGRRRDLIVPIDRSEPTVLFSRGPDDEPGDLSPDGQTLVIARPGDKQDLDLVGFDVATGAERWRLPYPGADHRPMWTPDGQSITFVNDGPGNRALMAIDVPTAGSAPMPRLIHNAGRSLVEPLGFTSEGWLYFSSVPPSRTVYVGDFDPERLTVEHVQLADSRTVESTVGPDWSASGQLAYIRGLQDASGPAAAIIDDVTRSRSTVVPLGDRYLHPVAASLVGPRPLASGVRWSPTDSRLAVVSAESQDPSGLTSLDVVDVSGAGQPVVASLRSAERIENVRWDPDGTALLYLGSVEPKPLYRQTVLLRYPLASGQPEELLRPQGCGALKSMDVDQKSGDIALLIFCLPQWSLRRLRDGQTWMLPADWRECLAVAWVGGTSGVLISVYRTGSARGELWHLDTATGDVRQVRLDTDFIFDLSLSDDGRRIAYTAGNPLVQVQRVRGVAPAR